MKVILLGAPGAGKGTQAEILSKKLAVPIVGTGKIIRDTIKSGSELGRKYQSYTDNGKLVPDEFVLRIVAERLADSDCRNGYILDGFPRTIEQAEALDQMGEKIDAVLSFEVSDEDIIERMAERRVCASCGSSYHLTNHPPKTAGVCDLCGGGLTARKDDQPETVWHRLKVYHERTEPLKEYYASHDGLVEIDAMQSVDTITQQVLSALGADAI